MLVRQPNRKRSKAITMGIADGILATGEACWSVVQSFASGKIVPVLPRGTRDADIRYAPRFARDLPSDTPGVKYTTASIMYYLQGLSEDPNACSVSLGNDRRAPSRWMLLALELLSLWELGLRDQQSDIIFIREGRVGFQLNALLKTCRKQSHKHRALLAKQKEAISILELCK
jgi:hypothetical protein